MGGDNKAITANLSSLKFADGWELVSQTSGKFH